VDFEITVETDLYIIPSRCNQVKSLPDEVAVDVLECIGLFLDQELKQIRLVETIVTTEFITIL